MFARICLSHLNCIHASIAIVPNGFHCTIIAEYINSYRENESFFFPVHSRKTKYSFTSPCRMIWIYFLFQINGFYGGLLLQCLMGSERWRVTLWWATPRAAPKSWGVVDLWFKPPCFILVDQLLKQTRSYLIWLNRGDPLIKMPWEMQDAPEDKQVVNDDRPLPL